MEAMWVCSAVGNIKRFNNRPLKVSQKHLPVNTNILLAMDTEVNSTSRPKLSKLPASQRLTASIGWTYARNEAGSTQTDILHRFGKTAINFTQVKCVTPGNTESFH